MVGHIQPHCYKMLNDLRWGNVRRQVATQPKYKKHVWVRKDQWYARVKREVTTNATTFENQHEDIFTHSRSCGKNPFCSTSYISHR